MKAWQVDLGRLTHRDGRRAGENPLSRHGKNPPAGRGLSLNIRMPRYIEHCAILWLVFTEYTRTLSTQLSYILDFIGNLRRAQGRWIVVLKLGPNFPLDMEPFF